MVAAGAAGAAGNPSAVQLRWAAGNSPVTAVASGQWALLLEIEKVNAPANPLRKCWGRLPLP